MTQGPTHISHAAVLALAECTENSEDTEESDSYPSVDVQHVDLAGLEKPTKKALRKLTANLGQGIDLAVASQRTVDSLTFTSSCKLRGANLGRLLRCFGNVISWSDSDNFELSQPVEALDAFISHNWSVNRFQKIIALCLHFNFKLVVLYLLVVIAVAVALKVTDHQAAMYSCAPLIGFSKDTPVTCRCLFVGVFPVIFWGRDLLAAVRLDRTKIFFDSLCIDQRSEATKAGGIKRLGAFIYRSRTMVAVCSNEYYMRLWTIYEMATFLALHPRDQLVLLPSVMTTCTFVLTLGFYALILLSSVDSAYNCEPWWGTIRIRVAPFVFIPISWIMVSYLRDWLIEFWQLEVKLRDFSLAKAACRDEADRSFVQANVVALARDLGLLNGKVSDSDAVAAFEGLVRREVPLATMHCTGRWGLPYRYLVFIGSPFIAWGVDHALAADDSGSEWHILAITFFWSLVLVPLSYVLLVLVVKYFVRCRGAGKRDWLAVTISTAVQLLMLKLCAMMIWALLQRLRTGEHEVAVMILAGLFYLLGALLAWLAFRKPQKVSSSAGSTGAFESAFGEWVLGISAPQPAIGCGKDSFPCPISNV